MTASPLRIEVEQGSHVHITWDDDERTTIEARTLRGACMCAGCREQAGGRATEAVLAGSLPITIEDAELVGGYAMKFVFGPDGHGTGIYPFEVLRSLG